MTRIGRNAPCPCGSGRKYKHCCLADNHGPFTSAERESALDRLPAALDAAGLTEQVPGLADRFGVNFADADLESITAAMAFYAFRAWMLFDVPLDDGTRLVDRLLAQGRLTRGERAYLTNMRDTAMRLYEVVDVRPGASVTVRGLVGGGEITVREMSASRSLQRWDLLAVRVSPCGSSGQPEFDGGIFPLHRSRRDAILQRLRDASAEYHAAHPDTSEIEFAKTLAPLFHAEWAAPVAPPKLVNFDGEPLVLVNLVFRANDVPRVRAALDNLSEIEREGDAPRWTWRGIGREQTQPVVLGWLKLEGDRLALETNSMARGERGRALVARHLGDLVTYERMTTRDGAEMVAQARAQPRTTTPAPAPELREAIERTLAQHYTRWLDEPVPALDHQTPRAAARAPELRPRLVEMLKDLEQAYIRENHRGQPAFNPEPLWDDLGLRPELTR